MNKRTLITGTILIAALAGGILFLRKDSLVKVQAAAGGKIKGPSDAPVKIVEYSDFQCPACMRAQAALNAIIQEYPGKIQVTYMHFPLPMHQWAGLAHQAAECANSQGKFWEYHDRVYGQQEVWSKSPNPSELLIAYAKDAGVNMDTFGACLSDPAVTRKILDEKAKGQTVQISSTPTFFINDERVVGPLELEMRGRNIIRKILGLPPLPVKAPVIPPAAPKAVTPQAAPQAAAPAAAQSQS